MNGAEEREIEKEQGASLQNHADARADGADAPAECPAEQGEGAAEDDRSGLEGDDEPEHARERRGRLVVAEGDALVVVAAPEERAGAPDDALDRQMGRQRALDSGDAEDDQNDGTDEYAGASPREKSQEVLLLQRLQRVSPHEFLAK